MFAPNGFAQFKTQEIREYWIEGFGTPIVGRIEDIEFIEKDDDTVETFLIICNKNKTRRYRVKLSAIAVSGEDLKAA